VLYGVREPDPALFAVEENPFGQWLTTTVVPQVGLLPEVLAMQRTLGQLLTHGQQLTRLYQQGRIEQARAGLEQIDRYAAQIEEHLRQLEGR
jgi:hypothetical protein